MQIVLNGEPREVPPDCTVAALLRDLGLTGRLAVEVNANVVPRGRHPDHVLAAGDRVEVVRAIGGG